MSYELPNNERLLRWVEEVAALCEPDRIHWCDGSQEEYDELCELLVQNGTVARPVPWTQDKSHAAFLT